MKSVYLLILTFLVLSCNRPKREFYSNGTLKQEYTINKNGKYHGTFKEYFLNGNLKVQRNFSDGIRIGLSEYFDSTGFINCKEYYNSGHLEKYELFNAHGNKTYEFVYLDTLNLPSNKDLSVRFLNGKDSFMIGDTTKLDIQIQSISKYQINVRFTNGTSWKNMELDSFNYSFSPNRTGSVFLRVGIQINDSIEKHIETKEYKVITSSNKPS